MKKYEFHTKRLITKKQEKAYRLCHHDFEGLSAEEAAERLGISVRAINRTLERLEKIAPQLFPILSVRQAEMWARFYHGGQTCEVIAEELEETVEAVIEVLQRVKKRIGYDERIASKSKLRAKGKPLSLDLVLEDESPAIHRF